VDLILEQHSTYLQKVAILGKECILQKHYDGELQTIKVANCSPGEKYEDNNPRKTNLTKIIPASAIITNIIIKTIMQ
jgi:hypothetical protein